MLVSTAQEGFIKTGGRKVECVIDVITACPVCLYNIAKLPV